MAAQRAPEITSAGGSKVVRLPTAPPRQVKQRCNRWVHEARRMLKESQGRQFGYISPGLRQAKRRIAEFEALPPTPTVIFARCLLDVHSGIQGTQAAVFVKLGADAGDPFAIAVESLLQQLVGTTFGEMNDYYWVRNRMGDTGAGDSRPSSA